MASATGRRKQAELRVRARGRLLDHREGADEVGKCETGMPVIGKFSTARSVWTP